MKRNWASRFCFTKKKFNKKWLLNFHLFAIKIWQNHIYHGRFGDGNMMFNELGIDEQQNRNITTHT